jgi:3-dehydrosphinganine reductase
MSSVISSAALPLSIILAIPVIAVVAMGLFSRKNHFVVDGRVRAPSFQLSANRRQTVLITGGSQGMGRGLAKICAQKGANVVIVARNVDKLKAAVEYISVRPALLQGPKR